MLWLSDQNVAKLQPLKKTYVIWWKTLTFESGKLWLLANGSVTISDTDGNVMLVTAGIKETGVNENADFFPLVVDYQDKFYATGKIGGNRFMKREWRPSELATLTSRLIDRPIRPMFPKWLVNDTQIIVTPLSLNPDTDLGYMGILGASLALMLSGAPFQWPVSGIKIIQDIQGNFLPFPSLENESDAKLSLLVAGTTDAVTMVESSGKQATQTEMMEWLKYAFTLIQEIGQAQKDFAQEYKNLFGIPEVQCVYNLPSEEVLQKVHNILTPEILDTLYGLGKKEFLHKVDELCKLAEKEFETIQDATDDGVEIKKSDIENAVEKCVKKYMRKNILTHKKRLDLRGLDEVRPLQCETGFLPRVHGSALFQRGLTQVLSTTTLGGPDDIQIIDDMYEETTRRYIHHYNFPPFSVGEVRMLRWAWRREIGHGKLAEKALEAVLPTEEHFPYMIRVVSETLTCNGSSSMASICGSTLSLMQAWVPITAPVAGIAMGMIYDEESGTYEILSDIQAQEDFLGDMDFKVAMTPAGITAMQLDVKIAGLSFEVFEEVFTQARKGIDTILQKMLDTQPTVSPKLSEFAPLIMTIDIPVEKIREVIGKGWENVQRMERENGVKISIAEDGRTTITARDQAGGNTTIAEIGALIWEPEVGYKGTGIVVKIIDGIGAIVDFKGKNGMIHISKLAPTRTAKVEDVVKIGMEVEFEVIEVNKEKGKISLKKKFETPKSENKHTPWNQK